MVRAEDYISLETTVNKLNKSTYIYQNDVYTTKKGGSTMKQEWFESNDFVKQQARTSLMNSTKMVQTRLKKR